MTFTDMQFVHVERVFLPLLIFVRRNISPLARRHWAAALTQEEHAMWNEIIAFITRDDHPFMEALDVVTRTVANDNVANDNEALSSDASHPEVA